MGLRRMHADEVDTSTDLVADLVAEQFPQWAGLPVAAVASSGTDNAMYRLGPEMAVRLPRIPGAVAAVEHEHTWLPRLAPALPAPVPAPLGRGGPGAGYPWEWSVLRWVEGANPLVGALPDAAGLAGDLAAVVTALRAVDPAGGPPAGRGVPLRTRDTPTRRAIAESTGLVDTAAVAAVWAEALRLPERAHPAAWCHGDLSPGNVLVSGGRLSGVIDFAGVGVGDPTVDLIVAWNLLPPEARDAFRTAVSADDATWLRGRAWALSIAIIQLPYYKDTNPALAANSRHVIAEVLTDAGHQDAV